MNWEKNQKKPAVLHCLSQETEAITLKELMSKLPSEFSERSVRRWLDELTQEGIVIKLGKKRGMRYQVSSRENRKIEDGIHVFSPKSKEILKKVRQPLFERPPVTYNEDWLHSYHPNHTFYLPQTLRTELLEAGARSENQAPAGTYAHQIFNRLLIDLSYNSSRLEGNTYSLLDTKRLLLEGSSADGKLDEEKIMILNHKEAIRHLVDRAPKIGVDPTTIFTLHYLLSDGLVESKYSGKVRDHGVRIGGSSYIPFESPSKLNTLLSQVLAKGAQIEDPFEQSLFLLTHLTYLQPFIDVNKRTARLCANIPLIKNNFVPLSFNDVEREDYISSVIAIYEFNETGPLVDLTTFSYMRTCALYDATLKSMGYDEIRVRYRLERRAIIRQVILNKLKGKALEKFLSIETERRVKVGDRAPFIQNIKEDLRDLDLARIVGLGITPDQLRDWLDFNRS